MTWKTYKIDLAPEDEKFLQDRKNKQGIALGFQLSEAVKIYIKAVKEKEASNG